MTGQRSRLLMLRQCELEPAGDVKLEYSLEHISPDSTTFYCNNAFHGEFGICCKKRGSEKCIVYSGMVEQLVSIASNSRNERSSLPLSPRLAGPRNHTLQQGYLSIQSWPQQSQ